MTAEAAGWTGSEDTVNRYLVIANQTIESPLLLEAIQRRRDAGPSTFHLLVPENHSQGATWDENQTRAAAKARLAEGLAYFAEQGVEMTGEVDATPVDGVSNILVREGVRAFDGIIISTLPVTLSRWLKLDAPSRIQRMTAIPVTHVVATMAHS
ncbi:hypothetical protein ACE2AJ_18210 [Aquihabitans daechungensis]|uniref:hypothetical protein n=1 Tax=Aquihabitans daechungensis TaxID=1052257 RepID=UPI003B9F2B7F